MSHQVYPCPPLPSPTRADSVAHEGVGLLAAVMSGHTSLVNDVLREAGAPSLAVAQVGTCGCGMTQG